MPLPTSTSRRVLQTVSVFWCIIFVVGVFLGSYWTIYNQQSLLYLFLDLAKVGKNDEPKSAEFIEMVLFGTIGVALASALMGFLSSFVILLERRWLTYLFDVFGWLLFLAAVTFSAMSFVGQMKATTLAKQLFEQGVFQYNEFTQGDEGSASTFRFLVDYIQMHMRCCGGQKGYEDYNGSFPNVRVYRSSKSPEGIFWACLCKDSARTDCKLQHLPLSCCVKAPIVDLHCASDVFPKQPLRSASCNTTKPNRPTTATLYHREGCSQKKIASMKHVSLMFQYGMINASIAFMSFVLSTLLCILGCKTASTKTAVKEEVQTAFQVSSEKAKVMIDEAKHPSFSDRPFDESRNEFPQRVSSERLAPQLSFRATQRSDRSDRPRGRAPPSRRK